LSGAQRQVYERRLTQLEASVARRSGELVMAGDLEPTIAARLHRRLEAIEMEIELLREALDGSDRP
jgi:endonuclease/exonuclease/phosphatase (EEP) superfamily protein YafD